MGADVTATFGVDLELSGAEKVKDTTKSLEELRAKISDDTKALREMQGALRSLQASTNVDIATFRKLRDQIAAKKVTLAQANQQLVSMKGAFKQIDPPAKGFLNRLTQITGVSKGLILVTAAVAAAFAAAAIGFVAFGVATADARRNEGLMLEAASAVASFQGALWGLGSTAVATGAQISAMQGVIDRVSASVPTGREEIAGYAKQLVKARLAGQDFEKALQAVSTAAAVGADASGLVGAFASLKFMGGSVDALAAKVQTKFGGIVKRQMLSLDVQFKKVKESWRALFRDVNVEPFLAGLHEILSLFSVSTVSGYALRETFTTLFKPMGEAVSFLTPIIKGFFKGLVIAGLMFTIQLLKIKIWLRDTFDLGKEKIDWLTVGMWAGVAAGGALAGAFVIMAASVALAVAPFALLGYAIYKLIDWGKQAWDFFADLDWSKLGMSIVDGLTGGLASGIPKFFKAIKDMGAGALNAFAFSIDSHSPSRKFAKIADVGIDGGLVQGTERGKSRVESAVGDVVSIPTAGGSATATASRGGVTVHLTIEAINVNAPQAKDAQAIAESIEGPLAAVLERAVQMLGGALEPETA